MQEKCHKQQMRKKHGTWLRKADLNVETEAIFVLRKSKQFEQTM